MNNRTNTSRRSDNKCLHCLKDLIHLSNKFCNQSCITAWTNIRRTISPEIRFWENVKKSDTCWLWIGSTRPNGYGRMEVSRENKTYATHRFSWELHNGVIPDGLFVLHKCDIPLCVNPNHLFLGTQNTNMKDRSTKKRFFPTQAHKAAISKANTGKRRRRVV